MPASPQASQRTTKPLRPENVPEQKAQPEQPQLLLYRAAMSVYAVSPGVGGVIRRPQVTLPPR